MKKKRFVIYGIAAVVSLFLIFNCAWGLYAYNYINDYTKVFTDSEYLPSYFTYKDGFSYSATELKYLDFTNNLSVVDENSNSLIIWKKPFSTEYGITIREKGYQMYLDENGNPTDKRNGSDANEIYNENSEIINELIKRANEFWEL